MWWIDALVLNFQVLGCFNVKQRRWSGISLIPVGVYRHTDLGHVCLVQARKSAPPQSVLACVDHPHETGPGVLRRLLRRPPNSRRESGGCGHALSICQMARLGVGPDPGVMVDAGSDPGMEQEVCESRDSRDYALPPLAYASVPGRKATVPRWLGAAGWLYVCLHV